MPLTLNLPSPVTKLSMSSFDERGINLYLKRDDLIHPLVQGNKWRKLKYSIQEVKKKGIKELVSPGGAFSNHLVALAAICREENLNLLSLVRGEDDPHNPSLKKLRVLGSKIKFVDRTSFRQFHEFTENQHPDYPNRYFIPEGGSDLQSVKGVGEIWTELKNQLPWSPDFIAVSMGSGGTFAGLLSHMEKDVKLLGLPVVSNYDYRNQLLNLVGDKLDSFSSQYDIIKFKETGKFARLPDAILNFIKQFKNEHQILLDPIYTGKMMWSLHRLILSNYFPNPTKIVAIHTGGIQGWDGFRYRFPEKGRFMN